MSIKNKIIWNKVDLYCACVVFVFPDSLLFNLTNKSALKTSLQQIVLGINFVGNLNLFLFH